MAISNSIVETSRKMSLFRWEEKMLLEKAREYLKKRYSFLIEKMICSPFRNTYKCENCILNHFVLCETSIRIVPKGSFASLNTVSSLNINYICNILNCTFSYYILIYYIFNVNNVLI